MASRFKRKTAAGPAMPSPDDVRAGLVAASQMAVIRCCEPRRTIVTEDADGAALQTILERIFQHGITPPALRYALRPKVFWLFIHEALSDKDAASVEGRTSVKFVDDLELVKTDVGKGRAWLRYLLNKHNDPAYREMPGLFIVNTLNELTAPEQQNRLKSFYAPHAFLRSPEDMRTLTDALRSDVAGGDVSGGGGASGKAGKRNSVAVEPLRFNLRVNDSSLDRGAIATAEGVLTAGAGNAGGGAATNNWRSSPAMGHMADPAEAPAPPVPSAAATTAAPAVVAGVPVGAVVAEPVVKSDPTPVATPETARNTPAAPTSTGDVVEEPESEGGVVEQAGSINNTPPAAAVVVAKEASGAKKASAKAKTKKQRPADIATTSWLGPEVNRPAKQPRSPNSVATAANAAEPDYTAIANRIRARDEAALAALNATAAAAAAAVVTEATGAAPAAPAATTTTAVVVEERVAVDTREETGHLTASGHLIAAPPAPLSIPVTPTLFQAVDEPWALQGLGITAGPLRPVEPLVAETPKENAEFAALFQQYIREPRTATDMLKRIERTDREKVADEAAAAAAAPAPSTDPLPPATATTPTTAPLDVSPPARAAPPPAAATYEPPAAVPPTERPASPFSPPSATMPVDLDPTTGQALLSPASTAPTNTTDLPTSPESVRSVNTNETLTPSSSMASLEALRANVGTPRRVQLLAEATNTRINGTPESQPHDAPRTAVESDPLSNSAAEVSFNGDSSMDASTSTTASAVRSHVIVPPAAHVPHDPTLTPAGAVGAPAHSLPASILSAAGNVLQSAGSVLSSTKDAVAGRLRGLVYGTPPIEADWVQVNDGFQGNQVEGDEEGEAGVELKPPKGPCAGCKKEFDSARNEPKKCHLTLEYYCSDCHRGDLSLLPDAVVHDWNFKLYPVCVAAKGHLEDISNQPLLDIDSINPQLVDTVPALKTIQKCRQQLKVMLSYIIKCPHKEELLPLLGKRDYFCLDVSTYSLRDLVDVKDRGLAEEITAITQQLAHHIRDSCENCRAYGFICPWCDSDIPIYPFDEQVTKCPVCRSYSHARCVIPNTTCPKCVRVSRLLEKRGGSLARLPTQGSDERMRAAALQGEEQRRLRAQTDAQASAAATE